MARLSSLTDAQLDNQIQFADRKMGLRDMLWGAILMHVAHHRGQLAMMCRLAGGKSPGIYGPNREEMAAVKERMAAKV